MDREYVGIDLHRRRSVIYRMDAAGEKLDCVRIDNDPVRFAEEVANATPGSDVVIEATYGWYWAADLLRDMGYSVHLAHPRGNDWGKRRVKNDERDASGPGRPVAARSPGRGVDRPTGDPGAAGDGALPGEAVEPPHGLEGPAARGDGQEWRAGGARRHVGRGWRRPARRARAG